MFPHTAYGPQKKTNKEYILILNLYKVRLGELHSDSSTHAGLEIPVGTKNLET